MNSQSSSPFFVRHDMDVNVLLLNRIIILG